MEERTPSKRGPKPNPHTRDSLIDAGLRMLHTSGYTATGVKDIVDEAKVPKGSFYGYFESKEAFGAEVVDAYYATRMSKLGDELGDPARPPIERLKGYFERRIELARKAGYVGGCLLGNFSLEVADQSELIRARVATHFQSWCALLEACIAEAQARGDVRSPTPASELAAFVLNSWEGALLRMRADKSDEPLKNFMHIVFGTVLV